MQEYPRYLYRAPFVVTGNGPVIADGAVLTEDGRVAVVGSYADLKDVDAQVENYEGHVITPALVNCHAHLELSYLAALNGDCPAPGDMTGWIRGLLAARAAHGDVDVAAQNDASLMALARLYAGGCRAVADIGNREESGLIGGGFKTEVLFFLELLGLCGESEKAALTALAGIDADVRCTAHAPYSTGPALIRALKKRAGSTLFPMHVAESAQEIEFLRTGGGAFADFLGERGLSLESFPVPGMGAVRYLDALGVLDRHTLCVHGVHVEDEELSLLAARGTAVCLCPGSNRFMGVGTAPVQKMLAHGIPLVLGTDSLASNPHLSLWREMQVLREDHPGLPPEAVFAMASGNGAHLLGIESRIGAIAPGVSSSLLAVRCPAKNEAEVLEFLTSAGADISLEWLE